MKNKKLKNLALSWLNSQEFLAKESTYVNYFNIISNHIIPNLGQIPINKLKKEDLILFNNKLLTNGNKKNDKALSTKTVKDINSILQQILEFSELKIKVKTPKVIIKEISIFEENEMDKLLNYCLKNLNTYTLGIIICLFTGLRIGEICALKWENIDLSKKIITIKNTILRINDVKNNKSKIIITEPKTESSYRKIPINKFLYSILKKFSQNDNFYVLTGSNKYKEPR